MNSKYVVQAVAVCGILGLTTLCQVARAQEAGTAGRTTVVIADNGTNSPLMRVVPKLRWEKAPIAEVAGALTRATGVPLLVDGNATNLTVTMQTGAYPTLGAMLGALAETLGPGVTVRLVAVPARESVPDADGVRRLLAAHEGLRPLKERFVQPANTTGSNGNGQVVASVLGEDGKPLVTAAPVVLDDVIDVAGQKVAWKEAAPLLTALKLRPVFFLSNPQSGAMVARSLELQNESLQLWMEMSPQQRQQAAEAQFSGLLNMDGPTRQALFGQMQQVGATMMQKFQSMPEAQRKQFFLDITGGRSDGTGLPSGGGNNGGATPKP